MNKRFILYHGAIFLAVMLIWLLGLLRAKSLMRVITRSLPGTPLNPEVDLSRLLTERVEAIENKYSAQRLELESSKKRLHAEQERLKVQAQELQRKEDEVQKQIREVEELTSWVQHALALNAVADKERAALAAQIKSMLLRVDAGIVFLTECGVTKLEGEPASRAIAIELARILLVMNIAPPLEAGCLNFNI